MWHGSRLQHRMIGVHAPDLQSEGAGLRELRGRLPPPFLGKEEEKHVCAHTRT